MERRVRRTEAAASLASAAEPYIQEKHMNAPTQAGRALLCALGAVLVIAPVAQAAQDPNHVSRKLRAHVTVADITQHMHALEDIASANGDSRRSGTPGYAAARDYVADRLEDAGLDVSVQEFNFDFYRKTGPASFAQTSGDPDTSFVEDKDFAVFDYSGSGTASGAVQAVDVNYADPSVITSGCETSDFAGFTPGNVALLQRGGCSFGAKAMNAQNAGAAAAIVSNQGNAPSPSSPPPRSDIFPGATVGAPMRIPAIFVSAPIGRELSKAGTTVSITTQTENDVRPTWNVVADLAPKHRKKAGKTVLVGAPLDPAVGGPSADHGSGASTILTIAEQMADARPPANPVRFAFWGGEEPGHVGAKQYVASLSQAEMAKIGLELDFGWLGAPNFARFVFDADGRPAGSGAIEQTLTSYFASQGLATVQGTESAFEGRAAPFTAAGIPVGGLSSGGDAEKSEAEAQLFGGVAGQHYDACYGLPCDTVSGNVDMTLLDQMADGAAHVIAVYAKSGKGKG
jgi:Zn-dependent M28 family amino/carboxypeptidase